MKTDKERSQAASPPVRRLAFALAALLALAGGEAAAQGASFSGDSTTIFRMREGVDDKHYFPLYEYLHLSAASGAPQGSVSAQLGLWGRVDLWDETRGKRTNGDVQYGFISYRGARDNLQLQAGRQWVLEGVAAERVDGLYARSDFAGGVQGSAFVGTPVTTDPSFDGGELIYGGRVAHSRADLYSVGLSALRNQEDGDGLREEEGIDLWLRPARQVDLTGRSSYNSLTGGWQEHAWAVAVTPLDPLRVTASLNWVDYRDYFHHVTTSALALVPGGLSPREEMLLLSLSAGYTLSKSLGVSADYRHYDYEVAGDADSLGVGATFSAPNALTAGASLRRMEGSGDRLDYTEGRVWANQRLGAADVTLDVFDVYFDRSVNGRKNTVSVSGAVGYDFGPRVRVAGDLEYLRSVDLDNELKALVKVVYAFDTERRGK